MVYEQLRTRWDLLDIPARRDAQRRIYHLQLEHERTANATIADPAGVLLLDRGTVDGSGYWPEGPEDYWRELGTSAAAELARYDAVIWLQTWRGGAGPLRRRSIECPAARVGRAGDRVGRADAGGVAGHPRVFEVGTYATLEEKVAAVAEVVERA